VNDGRHDGQRLDWIREDVHIHASYEALHARVADPAGHADWLSGQFRDFECERDACSFTLALPFRAEDARLRRDSDEPGSVAYVREGDGQIEALTFAIHPEGPAEVHLTIEARYRPAGGILGPLLEVLLHRPQRTQALRDSLWNLKQIAEREG
jgi:hypothetical protein